MLNRGALNYYAFVMTAMAFRKMIYR